MQTKYLDSPAKGLYIITERGKVYRSAFYEDKVKEFTLLKAIDDNLGLDTFIYSNHMIFAGNKGIYALNLKNEEINMILELGTRCIYYMGNDLIAIGNGQRKGNNTGFVRIYRIQFEKEFSFRLIKDISLPDEDILSIVSNKEYLAAYSEGKEVGTIIFLIKDNFKLIEKIYADWPIVVGNKLILTNQRESKLIIYKEITIQDQYSQVFSLTSKLFLAEAYNDNNKYIALFNEKGEKLLSHPIKDWIRAVRIDPTQKDSYILLGETRMYRLHITYRLELSLLIKYPGESYGYPASFEIVGIDPEEYQKYIKYIGDKIRLAKSLIGIIVRFL